MFVLLVCVLCSKTVNNQITDDHYFDRSRKFYNDIHELLNCGGVTECSSSPANALHALLLVLERSGAPATTVGSSSLPSLMAATTTPLITVSYGGVKHQMPIGVRPALELNDAEVDEAEEQLRTALRSAFSLPDEAQLTVHETESGRSLSKESFRDPANLARFPKYWYLRVDNGYSSSGRLFDPIDRDEEGQVSLCIACALQYF